MSTFSQIQSNDGKFNLKLEYSDEGKPSKLLIEAISPKNESVTVSDLADAVYYNCFEGCSHSFELGEETDDLPCKVKRGMECRDIKVSWFNSYDKVLNHIASQIGLKKNPRASIGG